MFVNGSGQNNNLYRGPSIDASYQISVHLGSGFREDFLEINQSKIRMACSGLLTDRDEMNNLNRGPSIDASYQVLVHLTKRFQRRRF
jgi:hypothetical protein